MYIGKRQSNYTKIEYSKKIVLLTGIMFISQIITAIIFSYNNLDTSIIVYTITATGGVFGASIIFYLNKAKLENAIKIKVAFYKLKLNLSREIPEEYMDSINNEFDSLEQTLGMKIDSTIEEAVNEDVSIPQY